MKTNAYGASIVEPLHADPFSQHVAMMRKETVSFLSFILFCLSTFCLFMLAGCASSPEIQPSVAKNETRLITDIQVSDLSDSCQVRIRGNQSLTFTSVKQPSGEGIALYFPDTGLGQFTNPQIFSGGDIQKIYAFEMSKDIHTIRVDISLNRDTPYEISRDNLDLIIAFQKTLASQSLAEQPVAQSAQAEITAQRLIQINPVPMNNGTRVDVVADGTIRNYKSFTLENPARIVFDMFGINSPTNREETIPVQQPGVKTVRYYADTQKLRLVIETDSANLDTFTDMPVADGLQIQVGQPYPVSSNEQTVQSAPSVSESSPSASALAWINQVDFLDDASGRSVVTIGTTHPVSYTVERPESTRIRLKLADTRLSDYRKYPLITTRFQSAVDRIVPSAPKSLKNTAYVDIDLRESVPYQVEQDGNLIYMRFDPSSLPPAKGIQTAAVRPVGTGLTESTVLESQQNLPVETSQNVPEAPTTSVTAETKRSDVYRSDMSKVYTGDKIAFDFFDTDIRNVFKIIGDISGQNFAIDKDVSGRVTLNLSQPVPWDQALDLILRMNGLDKVQEGDIIRIATLAKLQAIETERQKIIEAEIKAKEQQVIMEPMITEYLPINYAKAAEEMKPHLDGILTPGRGTISVDVRTNQIIMTDIPAKIQKAKEIIHQLDRVTPQVIIEAKIVEASTNFSRELGITWNAVGGIQGDDPRAGVGPQRGFDTLGGTYGYDAAVNLPTPSDAGVLGINFTKIAGTPLLINATLKAMETNGLGRVISAPKVLTMDNKEAFIEQGLEVGYLVPSTSTTTTASTVEFKKVTLNLKVTPHVTLDNRITMKVEVIKDDILGYFEGIPRSSTKKATTELLIDDGDTLVIGGITKTSENDATTGIPLLSKIPIVGWLFKNNTKDNTNEELLIFITPRILQLEQRAMVTPTGKS